MIVDISKQRLNYDTIAHRYDEPVRDYTVDPNLVDYLAQQRHKNNRIRVLDLGCGTGKQLTADSNSLHGIQFVGMDLFSGMLGIARKRGPSVDWIHGDSANPPFESDAFDYITNQYSYQHVQQQEKMISEVYRLLRRDGRFVINNIDPWSMQEWLIYQYFPAAWELDQLDFLPVKQLVHLMESAKFTNIHVSRRQQVTEITLGEAHAYLSRRTAASQLMAIPDAAYFDGIEMLEQALANFGKQSTIQSTICFLTIIGNKT